MIFLVPQKVDDQYQYQYQRRRKAPSTMLPLIGQRLPVHPLVSNNQHITRTNHAATIFSCFFHWWFTFQHLSPIVGRFVNFESHQFCKTFLDALHKPSNRKKLLTHLGLSVRRVRRAGDPRYGMDRDGFWWGAWNATGNKTSTKTMITMGFLGILQGDNIIWY